MTKEVAWLVLAPLFCLVGIYKHTFIINKEIIYIMDFHTQFYFLIWFLNMIIRSFLSFQLVSVYFQSLNARSRALLMQKLDRSGNTTRCNTLSIITLCYISRIIAKNNKLLSLICVL